MAGSPSFKYTLIKLQLLKVWDLGVTSNRELRYQDITKSYIYAWGIEGNTRPKNTLYYEYKTTNTTG
jgi:hypothetical protein